MEDDPNLYRATKGIRVSGLGGVRALAVDQMDVERTVQGG
jgi:hypothetical protein